MRSAGYEVYKPLIAAYTRHLAAEEKRLFPNGRPPYSLQPPARADEKQFTADELNAAIDGSDVAIISLGRKSGEAADRSEADFYLKDGEKQLIKAVSEAYHAKGKQVVVLLDICSPVDVASWQNQVDALVCTWQGGQESGFAVADVLSGRVDLGLMVYSPYRKHLTNYSRAIFRLYYQILYRNDVKGHMDLRQVSGKSVAYMASRPLKDTLTKAGAVLYEIKNLSQATKDLSEVRLCANFSQKVTAI